MSHFSVLVIGENWEEQLEPYWELDLPNKEMEKDPRAVFEVKIKEEDLEEEFRKFLVDPEKQKYMQENKLSYSSSSEWLKDWHGFVYSSEHKAYGYWHNPKAKWDWHKMGGRWCGFFKLKEGKKGLALGQPGAGDNEPEFDSDQALKGDIDWDFMLSHNTKEAEKRWEEMKNDGKLTDDDKYWRYSCEKGETKEEYIKERSTVSTFAVVKDSVWYERGKMDWWGIVTDEKEHDKWNEEWTKLVMSLPDDTLLTIVDCHI